MQNEILNYFSKTHAQYIHAKGEIGTRVLIQTLNCQSNEDVLEIGFGTGTTLTQIYSNNKKTRFYGLEQSPLMYKKAKARLRFSLIGESIKLGLMEQKDRIPFPTNSFDKIFLESVLGIQEDDDLQVLLGEIGRVLKPNGILVMNETIWLNSTNMNEILYINDFCKRSFGIIQSSSDYPYLRNWIDLLARLNFECESVIKLDEVKEVFKSEFRFPYRLLSLTFTALGKIKSNLSSSMIKERKSYSQKEKQINPGNKPLMEGIIIKAVNKK
ncbi:MAG: class I SAM-dependent methyltransferase [Ignavibacteriaceae bacterium]